MKILISYASAGAGHFKAAQAIYNCFKEKNNPDFQLEFVDLLQYSNRLFKNTYITGYTFLVHYAPWLWAIFFHFTNSRLFGFISRPIHFISNSLNTMAFTRLIIKQNPDLIISTHFWTSEISAYLKRRKKIKSSLITVVTDFMVHPFWISKGTDLYIVASEITQGILVEAGVASHKIMVLGIPVDKKFQQTYDKKILCQKLGLEENKFTVLIVTGSFGLGPIEEIIECLPPDTQVMAVCARNKKLFLRLTKKKYPHLKVFGFVDNIHELMSASDVIITKPGGLTISEVLSLGRVPVFISAIPGQEKGNVAVLSKYGIGVEAKSIPQARAIILDYQSHPDRLNRQIEIIQKVRKPFAAEELYNVVCQGGFRPSA